METLRSTSRLRTASRSWLPAAALLSCLAPAFVVAEGDAPAAVSEYEAKAAFLYNFGFFVKWPDSAFRESGERLVVGVLGKDPFGGLLEETLEGVQVEGRTLHVQHYSRPEDVTGVHILFIGEPESRQTARVVQALRGAGVLTVGEEPGFAAAGGMVEFMIRNNRVRLQINLRSAEQSGLRISSQLLKLATIVPGRGSD